MRVVAAGEVDPNQRQAGAGAAVGLLQGEVLEGVRAEMWTTALQGQSRLAELETRLAELTADWVNESIGGYG